MKYVVGHFTKGERNLTEDEAAWRVELVVAGKHGGRYFGRALPLAHLKRRWDWMVGDIKKVQEAVWSIGSRREKRRNERGRGGEQ